MWVRLLSVLAAFALVAAACGGDDDTEAESPSPSDSAETETETETETDATDGDGAETDNDGAETASDAAETEGGETDDGETDAMAPQRGGTLTFLLEGETDSFVPGGNCAAACIQVMRSVGDPLTIVNSDNEVEPFLLETFESNDDFTEFTLVLRDGVMFHDGTLADGAAVKQNLEARVNHPVAGSQFVDVSEDGIVLVDDMTVTVSMDQPVATFGYIIAERAGWLLAPSYLDDPDNAAAFPIGTGPFVMTEWVRGEQSVLEANPNYWRTDANGEALPYLDRLVFRPVPDPSTRRSIMVANDADASMDSAASNVGFWQNEWDGGLVETAEPREVFYLMPNSASETFSDPEMRRALALCTDRDEYITFRAPNDQAVNGPFAEGDLGYLEDTGFPPFDPEAGNGLLDEIGRPEVITYTAVSTSEGLLTAELFADQWSTNCGLTVEIEQFDQTTLITKALTSDFEVILWRNHGQGHPGLELVWWHSRHAEGLALNFGRLVDEELDALLEATQATTDLAELDDLAKQMNQVFAAGVYNIWLNSVTWSHAFRDHVHGIGVMSLESGNVGQTSIAGRTWLGEAWIES